MEADFIAYLSQTSLFEGGLMYRGLGGVTLREEGVEFFYMDVFVGCCDVLVPFVVG